MFQTTFDRKHATATAAQFSSCGRSLFETALEKGYLTFLMSPEMAFRFGFRAGSERYKLHVRTREISRVKGFSGLPPVVTILRKFEVHNSSLSP